MKATNWFLDVQNQVILLWQTAQSFHDIVLWPGWARSMHSYCFIRICLLVCCLLLFMENRQKAKKIPDNLCICRYSKPGCQLGKDLPASGPWHFTCRITHQRMSQNQEIWSVPSRIKDMILKRSMNWSAILQTHARLILLENRKERTHFWILPEKVSNPFDIDLHHQRKKVETASAVPKRKYGESRKARK